MNKLLRTRELGVLNFSEKSFDLQNFYIFKILQVGKKGTFSSIAAVTVGPMGEIVVADARVQMFSAKGDFMEIVYDDRKGKVKIFNHTINCDQ